MPAAPAASEHDISTIAIIGAGPSGLATAKCLFAEDAFSEIVLFEQRGRVGGVWDYIEGTTKPNPETCGLSSPPPWTEPTCRMFPTEGDEHSHLARDDVRTLTKGSTKNCREENGLLSSTGASDNLTPLYDGLETNIPRSLMGFSDLDWPSTTQLFPRHQDVLTYIERYAESVKHLIQFHTTVTDVRPAGTALGTGWVVTTRDVHGAKTTRHFDAVVVASGHFAVPHVPDVPGLKEWRGKVGHSMFFSTPEEYRGKKVLLIGNGASGIDIASHIAPVCAQPLLHSSRSTTAPSPSSPAITHHLGLKAFVPHTRSAVFTNAHTEHDIDTTLFCTGYFYAFPWLHLPPTQPVATDGTHLRGLYKHLLYAADTSLAFPVLQQRVIPFPMAEAQGAVLARLWSGRLPIPEERVMHDWEEDLLRTCHAEDGGGGRAVHLLPFPRDAEYINEMHDWAASAGRGGKVPPRWGRREFWLRERFAEIKKRFQAEGEGRREVRTVEELGFDFEAWRREQGEDGGGRVAEKRNGDGDGEEGELVQYN